MPIFVQNQIRDGGMSKSKDKEYGIVYLLTNEAMPGMVKIGMTMRDDLTKRLNELYTTGVPLPFSCAYACQVPQDRVQQIETALHAAFAPQRVNESREFFRVSTEQVIPILKAFNDMQEITQEVEEQIGVSLTEEDRVALSKARSIKRRPSLNYVQMGLQVGQELVYVNDPEVVCTVSGERKVLYNDEETSLTKLTTSLLGLTQAIQPTKFWTVNGRNLLDLYNETYPPVEEE